MHEKSTLHLVLKIKDKAYSPLLFILFSLKKKCCWCIQNYLWDVWWKCYSQNICELI